MYALASILVRLLVHTRTMFSQELSSISKGVSMYYIIAEILSCVLQSGSLLSSHLSTYDIFLPGLEEKHLYSMNSLGVTHVLALPQPVTPSGLAQ